MSVETKSKDTNIVESPQCIHSSKTESSAITSRCSSSRKNQNEKFSLLLFQVIDSGIGISQEVMNELFSPFKQAQRLAGGTGLGLYSLAKRMEALGGYYGVRARDDGKQGSNFWFAIPYKSDPISSKNKFNYNTEDCLGKAVHLKLSCSDFNQNKNGLNSPKNSCGNLLSLKSRHSDCSLTYSTPSAEESDSVYFYGLNILLIDDSLSILKMTGSLFRKYTHNVTEAVNGADALLKLAAVRDNKNMRPFDVIIMDLHMPIMDGKLDTSR